MRRLSILLLSVGVVCTVLSCAQKSEKKDEPSGVVGSPPAEGAFQERRGRLLGQDRTIESPSGKCDAMWADNPVEAAKCAHYLTGRLIIQKDRRAAAMFWPEADLEYQVIDSNGDSDTVVLKGKNMREELSTGLVGPNLAYRLGRIWSDEFPWTFERSESGAVRASVDADNGKFRTWWAPVDGEIRLMRNFMIVYGQPMEEVAPGLKKLSK